MRRYNDKRYGDLMNTLLDLFKFNRERITRHVMKSEYGKGTPPPGLGAPTYPIDTGLTMGILPWDEVQSEATARSSRPARSSARPRQTSTWD